MVDTECGGGKGKTKLAVAALAPSVVMFAAGCFSSAALTIRVAINSGVYPSSRIFTKLLVRIYRSTGIYWDFFLAYKH